MKDNGMNGPDTFEIHRAHLFAVAYRMLGSASEAEDVMQDAYLRYVGVAADDIRSTKAYLTTVVTRLCLDRLKAARVQREQYLGSWLPEPVLTAGHASNPEQMAEQHESITLAFLVLLESLSAQERAVFLLREVFEYEYDEIASMVQLSVANCRQLVHRAKAHLAAQRPRFQTTPARQQELVTRFLAATQRGDVDALAAILAQDAILWADSGGKAPAPRKPVQGRDVLAPLFLRFVDTTVTLLDDPVRDMRLAMSLVNDEPAVLLWIRDQLDSVLVVTADDHHITALRLIRNPLKLAYIVRQFATQEAGGYHEFE
jgi:RNA polymerase sigma-70 factor (ECF subfamily)